MDSCEVLVFNINEKSHHEDMFLDKQNIQWMTCDQPNVPLIHVVVSIKYGYWNTGSCV
jgi:hypothetical protein